MLGKAHSKLGPKAEALLMDVKEINRLIFILLNSNCVQFYESIIALRESGSVGPMQDVVNDYSVFRYADPDTQ